MLASVIGRPSTNLARRLGAASLRRMARIPMAAMSPAGISRYAVSGPFNQPALANGTGLCISRRSSSRSSRSILAHSKSASSSSRDASITGENDVAAEAHELGNCRRYAADEFIGCSVLCHGDYPCVQNATRMHAQLMMRGPSKIMQAKRGNTGF